MKNLFIIRKTLLFSIVTISFLLFSVNANASFPVKKNSAAVENNIAGEKVNHSDDIAVVGSGKSQTTALILAIFIGTLGVHRFYLGYAWQGIVQLLTFGGLGIWSLIDLIRIITGDLQPKNGSYSQTL